MEMAKSKEKAPKTESEFMTLVCTILIIAISVLSVIAVFMASDIQYNARYNQEAADKHKGLVGAIEDDIEYIMGQDTPYGQLALIFEQEFLVLNRTIGEMIEYNVSNPFSYMQWEVDAVAIQAALKINRKASILPTLF